MLVAAGYRQPVCICITATRVYAKTCSRPTNLPPSSRLISGRRDAEDRLHMHYCDEGLRQDLLTSN